MHPQYEIALANTDDAADLAALRASWVADDDVTPTAEFVAESRSWIERESGHRLYWIARTTHTHELGGDLAVAMVNLSIFERMPSPDRPPSRWGYLGNMFVRASHRDTGLGAQLLGAVLDHADANGLVHVMLNPTERSQPFYGRAGFTHEHDILIRRPPERD